MVVSLAVAAAVAGASAVTPAAAAGTCTTSQPSSNAYSVTLCITAPAAGSTLTGAATVTSTVAVTGSNPSIRELVYTLNGAKLLWDFQAPYGWVLDSTRWVDGTYTLQVYAIMQDGFNTAQTTESLTFSNGITTPPVNNATFIPSVGTAPPPGQPVVVGAVGDGAAGQTSENDVVNFISLDNISKFIGSGTSNTSYVAETNWLKQDLANNTSACTIAYFHEPMFNVGPEGSATNTTGIWQILAQHHVTTVLNGHDHDYQRWVPLDGSGNPNTSGVTEFVGGSG